MNKLTLLTGIGLIGWSSLSNAQPGDRAQEAFNAMDTDGDGNISFQEFSENGRNPVERLDSDGDGLVSLDEFLAGKGWEVERPLALASSEAIKLSVMSNMGVGILSAYALVYADADGLVQLPVSGFPVTTQWHVIHLRQKRLSPVAESFLRFMLDEGRVHLPMDRIEARVRQARGE